MDVGESGSMALPSIQLIDIPQEGLSLVCDVQPDELALSPDEGRVLRPLSLLATVAVVEERIHVTGVLTGIFLRQCVRCLKEYEDPAEVPFAAEYRRVAPVPKRRPSAGKEIPPSEIFETEPNPDADIHPCYGDQLQLTDMLREHIILATPMQPLCYERCAGLCQTCGHDLNQGDCGCAREARSTPFEVLQAFRHRPADPGAEDLGLARRRPKLPEDQ
jgi:uncharacterized protein